MAVSDLERLLSLVNSLPNVLGSTTEFLDAHRRGHFRPRRPGKGHERGNYLTSPSLFPIAPIIEEVPMRISKSVLAAATVLALGSAAWAQAQQIQGKVTKIDKANKQISLQRTSGQTVGNAGAATETFKLLNDMSYDTLKVGDQLTIKVDNLNGVRQITKWDKM
jgi:Cu/Ag efflux protein CusF